MGAEFVYVQGSEKLAGLRLTNVRFSYAYLLTPRPEKDLKAGTYGADLLIDLQDKEAIQLLNEYFSIVEKDGIETAWNGKRPKNLKMPYRQGDGESNEIEEGTLVLKTTSNRQPALYIREEGEEFPRKISDMEEAEAEIYSGMIGEALVKIVPFNWQNTNQGYTAYISAVCKTGKGTVIGAKTNYDDVFSTVKTTDVFSAGKKPDTATPAKQEASKPVQEDVLAALANTKSMAQTKKPTSATHKAKAPEPEPEPEAPAFSLASLLAEK